MQLGMPADKSPPAGGGGGGAVQPEAAMADMAFLQALMMQMMTGGQFPGPMPGLPSDGGAINPLDMGVNPESMEPPPEPANPNPNFLFNCCVCQNFGTDSMDA